MLKTSKRNILRSTALAIATSTLLAGTASADSNIEFEISDGLVTPTEDFAAKVTVLGTAITSNGVDVPVTVKFRIGDQVLEPFGAYNDPNAGNVNNKLGKGRRSIVEQTFNANQSIDITATSWINGRVYLERNSNVESSSVLVLRDGDAVPDIAGFDSQADVAHYLRKYIDPDTKTMILDENQAIYLFELGTTNLSSSAADFQDAVILVTLGESPEQLDRDELMDAMYD
jgi:hypothetical protein